MTKNSELLNTHRTWYLTHQKVIEKYKSQFGIENVKIDIINKLIKIKNSSHMISVYDNGLEKWKYLEFNGQSISKIYGIETWAELNKYVR